MQLTIILTAKIETTGGDYAYLDDQGRYRLKSLFDNADTKTGEASHPVRMLQHLAGANYGMHFPLHAGTEVFVTCLNGNPDRPIILGAAPNAQTRSPVTSANASQHIIRTAAGNELLMDDMADSEKINLHTKDKKNILTLDANSDGHKLALRTEEGLAEFYAKKTMRFESGDTYTLITGNDQTITVENKHSLQTNKKEIAFDAATDIALTAKHNIKLNSEEKDISLTSGQDLIVEVGKGMSVQVMDGNSSYTIQQGSVSIEAAKAITLLSIDGPITIENGGGSVELSDGKLSVMGTTVSVEGDSVAIKGQMAEMTGGGGGGGAVASKAKAAVSTQAAPMMLAAADTGTMSDAGSGYGPVATTANAGMAAPATESSGTTDQFDEQIQFKNAKNTPLTRINYTLRLADGSKISGMTDDQGRTQRISTPSPQTITEATLEPRKLQNCCTTNEQHSAEASEPLMVKIDGVTTNSQEVGSSVQLMQTPEDETRGLTSGEIAMARLIFKDSIDYSKVKVHNGEYLWFGMQDNDTAMTPNGEMYFNPKRFKEDFSITDFGDRLLFMHEMVHIWQYQLGYPVKWRGAVRIGLPYKYTLETDKQLSDYNMEAQGNLLSDYWALKLLQTPPNFWERKHIKDLPLYEKVIRDFIANSASISNLPGGRP